MIIALGRTFLTLAGLTLGLNSAHERNVGPSVIAVVGSLLALGCALGARVLAIDPKRDLARVPLTAPWSAVLPWLSIGLLLAIPTTAGPS